MSFKMFKSRKSRRLKAESLKVGTIDRSVTTYHYNDLYSLLVSYQGVQVVNRTTGKEVPQKHSYYGTRVVTLNLVPNQKPVIMSVPRMVYTTVIGEIPEGYRVVHIDGNVNNCKPSNLVLKRSKY